MTENRPNVHPSGVPFRSHTSPRDYIHSQIKSHLLSFTFLGFDAFSYPLTPARITPPQKGGMFEPYRLSKRKNEGSREYNSIKPRRVDSSNGWVRERNSANSSVVEHTWTVSAAHYGFIGKAGCPPWPLKMEKRRGGKLVARARSR